MLNETNLEKRITNIEQAIADLQTKINDQPLSNNWLEKITGSISDDSAFLETLEYGEKWRKSKNIAR
ncbi:MAG: transferase hexapeptide repeat containing protein [Crocosphaera sp.]|nr:transferase hexapeptide repeat containing protein [Crocosphaera sp.]